VEGDPGRESWELDLKYVGSAEWVIEVIVSHRDVVKGLTRKSSATAGGTELSQWHGLFHKGKACHRNGQRLAGAIG
jgi:hypothetical protein